MRNENWAGDFNGETWPDRAERLTFRVIADPDTSYNALEAGEVDTANIPPARAAEARSNWGNTLDVNIMGSYHYDINFRDPRVGGDENLLLRQAISMAIDRDAINEAVYNGIAHGLDRHHAAGNPRLRRGPVRLLRLRPRGRPGGLRRVAGRRQRAAGRSRSSSTPTPATSRWWRSSSTTWRRSASRPRPTRGSRETYFSELADGACVFCRVGWFADYPTYDNFMYDLFHTDSLGRQQLRLQQPGVRRDRRRGQGDRRSRRPGAAVPAGRADPAQRGGRGGADQLVPRRLRLQPRRAPGTSRRRRSA